MQNYLNPRKAFALCWPWLALLAAIWAPVIYLLGAQWTLCVEYNYGWAVPFLCAYLVGQKWPDRPAATAPGWKKTALSLLAAAGLVYWGMRVLQEANPLWRVASYGLALAAGAMTLLVVYLTQGRPRAVHFIFPVAFFLVAVPWPSPIEQGIIQSLTRGNARLVVELLNFGGVPALQHGNVIEISAGMVGINEACSGIRSFQAALMMALFFGGFYHLRGSRRWILLAAGPGLAMTFNLARTLVLVLVAARAGLPTMERWHDLTGVILLVGSFLSLWGVAVWLGRGRPKVESRKRVAETEARPPAAGISATQRPSVSALALGLVAWAAVVELSTEAWFRSHEDHGGRSIAWSANWPGANPTLQTNIIAENSLRILQCDQDASASWTEGDGVFWQAFYLRWQPANSFYGRAREALSKFHNPGDCLPASGMKLQEQFAPVSLPVRPGFNLTFDRYVFTANGRELQVFFAQTEDTTGGSQASTRMTHLARLKAALAGSRNYGQNNFEVALAGPVTPADALRLFRARLPELIQIQPAPETIRP